MKNNLSNIKKAKKILDHQDCVAVPTETVYGLAANAYSDKAVKKIFKLKKRPQNNPLIVHYHNIDDLKRKLLKLLKYPLAAPSANLLLVANFDIFEVFFRFKTYVIGPGLKKTSK